MRPVHHLCDLFDALQGDPAGITLPDAVLETGIPKLLLLRYLAALESHGYVERDPASGAYRLGMALLPAQAQSVVEIIQRARPHLQELSAQFEGTASLGLLDGADVLYLDVIKGPESMSACPGRGDRGPLHSTALGKALAAALQDVEIREMLTATDPEAYLAELGKVRLRGWAMEHGEHQRGIAGVATAMRSKRFVVGLSLNVPVERLSSPGLAEDIARALRSRAADIRRAPLKP